MQNQTQQSSASAPWPRHPCKTQAGHQGFPSGRTKEPGLQHPQRRHGSKLRLAEPRQDFAAQKMSPAEAKPSCKPQELHSPPGTLKTPLPPCLQQAVFLWSSK